MWSSTVGIKKDDLQDWNKSMAFGGRDRPWASPRQTVDQVRGGPRSSARRALSRSMSGAEPRVSTRGVAGVLFS